VDKSDDATIFDPLLQPCFQPLVMNLVEKFRPVRLESQYLWIRVVFAPKGHSITAQRNALGNRSEQSQTLKGCPMDRP